MTTRFSRTQPICYECWMGRFGSRPPKRIAEAHRQKERCVDCGAMTWSGIYTTVNPKKAKHPTKTE